MKVNWPDQLDPLTVTFTKANFILLLNLLKEALSNIPDTTNTTISNTTITKLGRGNTKLARQIRRERRTLQ